MGHTVYPRVSLAGLYWSWLSMVLLEIKVGQQNYRCVSFSPSSEILKFCQRKYELATRIIVFLQYFVTFTLTISPGIPQYVVTSVLTGIFQVL